MQQQGKQRSLTGCQPLNETAKSVLLKGLNFAPAPSTIPYQDFIGAIEPAIRPLPQESAEEIRSKITLALKKAAPPKPNLSRDEKTALQELRRNHDIVILPADKGNAKALLKRESYVQKVENILQDSNYRYLCCLCSRNLPPETYKGLLPQAPAPPRLYGLPKVHKPGTPLRPIVSAINAPTYLLAKYLAKLLAPIIGHNEHHVQDSTKLVKTLANIKLDPDDILKNYLKNMQQRMDISNQAVIHQITNYPTPQRDICEEDSTIWNKITSMKEGRHLLASFYSSQLLFCLHPSSDLLHGCVDHTPAESLSACLSSSPPPPIHSAAASPDPGPPAPGEAGPPYASALPLSP
ncbi:hypothetical protein J437_LFUL015376 [Ladona fulva]|uniref:Uncharacterized protein n=1 Tax=Ladona fulva TaxID=123851 RepID=A0A8K0KLD9_LADFU|nr:hypothetical protein J437_LFUL015376 [Ladona fulva]